MPHRLRRPVSRSLSLRRTYLVLGGLGVVLPYWRFLPFLAITASTCPCSFKNRLPPR